MKRSCVLLAILFIAAPSFAADDCNCGARNQVVASAFKVHGRLSAWNGNPSLRIWIIGTKRMLGIREGTPMPSNLEKLLKNIDTEVYGDYIVCPLTRYQKGVMQIVCINSADKLISKERK